MTNSMNNYLIQTIHGLAFIAIGFLIFYSAKVVKDWIEPESIDDHLTQKDNFAVALSLTGYYFGIMLIFLSIISAPGKTFLTDVALVFSFSIFGIILLNVSHFISDKLILHKFDLNREIYSKRNVGAGVAVFGSYIANSIFISVALTGDSGKLKIFSPNSSFPPEVFLFFDGLVLSFIFFAIGQVAQIVFAFYYAKITSYDLQIELGENKNCAAGISFAGALIAIGILVAHSLKQEFVSFGETGILILFEFLLSLLLIPFLRYFAGKVILPGSSLAKEIAVDKNIGAGLIEACILVSFSGVIFFAL
ncbi:MAG: DUF350 domain-containing protein [Leptospira sp.]|nr:DUF350 domain-containing protein [Leptospira sp.]